MYRGILFDDDGVVAKSRVASGREGSLSSISAAFAAKGAWLLVSDKEGHFLILEESMSAEKAWPAVAKNFKEAEMTPKNAKK